MRLLGWSGVEARRGASSPCAPAWASSGLGSRARPHEPPPFAEAVYSAMLTHCNQYVSGFSRGALHGRPRRVGRRVTRESADPRGGRHVSRTAALSAADPTESYAQDDTHLLRACYEMSRFAHVLANDPMEGVLGNPTLQTLCYEIPRSQRFAARTAERKRRSGRTSTVSRAA